jgi:RNA polymerase sigma factor (sigma-70 family)
MVRPEGEDMQNGIPKLLDQLQQAGGGLTDGQLLARFVTTNDEASFATLLRRHGAMVLGVCRRVLRDFHDAEDAFQATFLVLARKAASVVKRESVGSWLYAVAYNTALEAANANSRRRTRERQMKDTPQAAVVPADVPDWRPVLDRELNHLPEKYRAAVVHCDLEGLTRTEAARVLRVPEGTLSSRLTRARNLLAKRLASRGVVLSAGLLTTLVLADAAAAQVPAALVGSTTKAAALVAAGQLSAAAGPAVVLMKGVMKAMLFKKLRLGVGALMVATALGAVGFVCRPGDEARAQQLTPPEPVRGKAQAGPDDLRKENEDLRATVRVLLKEISALEKELEALRPRTGAGDKRGTSPYAVPLGATEPGYPDPPDRTSPRDRTAPRKQTPAVHAFPMTEATPGVGRGPRMTGGTTISRRAAMRVRRAIRAMRRVWRGSSDG